MSENALRDLFIRQGDFETLHRRVFYSFHYANECRIAAQIRNIGSVSSERKPVYDNHWEKVPKNDDMAIARWINQQLERRTCTIVLIGAQTADRYWVQYEIRESWSRGMGVVGIYTHNLNDPNINVLRPTSRGENPFEKVGSGGTLSPRLSTMVKAYDPVGRPGTSEAYNWIAGNLNLIVQEAISIRKGYGPGSIY